MKDKAMDKSRPILSKFKDIKNRLFLEEYFIHKGNCSRAAKAIGIPRTTYHDWVQKHQYLIEEEVLQRTGHEQSN